MKENLLLGPLHYDGDLVCFYDQDGDEDSIASLFLPVREDDKEEEIMDSYGKLFAAAPEGFDFAEAFLTRGETGITLEALDRMAIVFITKATGKQKP